MAAPPSVSPVVPDDLVMRSFDSPKGAPPLPYRLYVPRDYVQTKRYPLLVVLHGSGERGKDNLAQLGNGVLAFCAPALQKRKPTFVMYPQCPLDARWVEAPWSEDRYQLAKVPLSRPLTALMDLIDGLSAEFTLDPRRLLISGLSMGGQGTWDLLARFPERFAGAMPICGSGDPEQAVRMKAVPVWAFHGARDNVVPVAGSRLMVQALKHAGGRVRYTEYADVAHPAWERAYADKKAIEWLLAQRQPPPHKP
jgi:predicted peptidase